MANVNYWQGVWVAGPNTGDPLQNDQTVLEFYAWGFFNTGDAVTVTAHPSASPPNYPGNNVIPVQNTRIEVDDSGTRVFFDVSNIGSGVADFIIFGYSAISQ